MELVGMFPVIRLQPDGEADPGDLALRLSAAGLLALRSNSSQRKADTRAGSRATGTRGFLSSAFDFPGLTHPAAGGKDPVFARLGRSFGCRRRRAITDWGRPQLHVVSALGAPGQCRGGLCGVSRQGLFSPSSGYLLPAPRTAAQWLGRFYGGRDSGGGERVRDHLAAAASLPLGRMGLVSRHIGADDRYRASWLPADGRSLYLLPVDRPLHCASSGRSVRSFRRSRLWEAFGPAWCGSSRFVSWLSSPRRRGSRSGIGGIS